MSDDREARDHKNMRNFAQTGDWATLDPGIGFERRRDRLISEILGMFRMSLHDGIISESEGKTMHDWIVPNPDTAFV